LSAHKDGVYNARTEIDGGVTSVTTLKPLVQCHEREISGVAVSTGNLATGTKRGVSEITVPVYLAYDDEASAVSAAAGITGDSGGMGKIDLAFDRPGTAKIAWLTDRKKRFHISEKTEDSATPYLPDSLQTVFQRMQKHRFYSKKDGGFSGLHALPSVSYTEVDVKEVEVTRVSIPSKVTPLVCSQPAPPVAANGSTVYPPGMFIVLFGFATLRCSTSEIVTSSSGVAVTTETGWVFWLKVIAKVVVNAIEIAAALGAPYPQDSTSAAWTASSNLIDGADSGAQLDEASVMAAVSALKANAKPAVRRLKTAKRQKKNSK
jgi:hypothetical protein